ncbi:hypothetical protein FHX48_000031 [Microbacterium halimionae]|uniref:DUF4097 domain-containing protein n=1 Tax=Microbacterium halimionae TaxID=1526413 RepID=A0A7W3PKM1_9MICO|nr:DUF4097 family beta strand repeat-containing protein [Microbacterium halimionae]MBA8814979.1 hypothetical protein [Microbacterium halimionae]NII94230.1 hypothetical protein [Microbacterium halimionae]
MTLEKWIIQPGQSRIIDIDDVSKLKIGMVGGQIDVVAHDEPGVRIEVHAVTSKDLRIEASGSTVEIDHPQLRWDNFLEVFRNFGSGGPKAEISVAVPREVAITLGVVSASALISGLRTDAKLDTETKLNTVSGDIFIDGLVGDISINAVSGDVQARNFTGALSANSVSGDVAAMGNVRKANIDTVSGAMLIDSTGDVHQINLNTVSGGATIRLDDALPANYVVRSVSGRVQVDGVVHSGKGSVPGTNYAGSTGELSSSFVDVRANSVSGDIIVLRRGESAETETEDMS